MDESTIAHAPRTVSPTDTLSAPLACPRCGTIDTPTLGPGAGPHWRSARCRHCGAWLGWLSRYTPAERQARHQQARDEAMAQLAPTEPQIQYLRALGDQGLGPANRAEASQRIDQLKRAKGVA
jgi:hypothetical protein